MINRIAKILVLCVIGVILFCLMMLYRNDWLLTQHIKIISTHSTSETLEILESLPEYNEMLWDWWVWDFEEFVGDKHD